MHSRREPATNELPKENTYFKGDLDAPDLSQFLRARRGRKLHDTTTWLKIPRRAPNTKICDQPRRTKKPRSRTSSRAAQARPLGSPKDLWNRRVPMFPRTDAIEMWGLSQMENTSGKRTRKGSAPSQRSSQKRVDEPHLVDIDVPSRITEMRATMDFSKLWASSSLAKYNGLTPQALSVDDRLPQTTLAGDNTPNPLGEEPDSCV